MNRSEGLRVARRFRDALAARGYAARRVVVFGSVARDEATEDSDLDIAVIGEPFAATRHEENLALRRVCRDVDIRIEPFSLHPDDFENPAFALPAEIEQDGVEV